MYQNPQSMFNPYSQNISIIKDYFKKPLVLSIAIISTIVTIASFVSSVFATPYMLRIVKFLGEVTEESLIYSADPSSAVISAIFPVLTTIAFYIIYSKSKNDDPYSNPVNGVSILSTVSLIQLILAIFSVAGTTGVFSIVYFMALGEMPAEVIASIVAIIASLILLLVFHINQYRFYRNIKNGLTSITLSKKGAGAFSVANIIYSIVGFISGFVLLLPLFMSNTEIEYPNTTATLDLKDIMPLFLMLAVVTILTSVQYVLIAILAQGYKKYIDKIANSFNNGEQPFAVQAYYPQTPYQPATAMPFAPTNNTNNYPMPLKEEQNPFELSTDDKITTQDYRPSDDTIVCPFCKKSLPKEVIFCDSCGNKVN